MKRVLILALALLIAFSSVSMVCAIETDHSEAMLQDLFMPRGLYDKNISVVNGTAKLVAYSPDRSLEFGADFDTDVASKCYKEIENNIFQDGNTLFEIVKLGSQKCHVYVKCSGTDDISSQFTKLNEADDILFMFNQVNGCRPVELD